MPCNRLLQSATRILGTVLVLGSLSLVSAGSSYAGNALACKGSTKSSVVACLLRETGGRRPIWMNEPDQTWESVVACGGSKKTKNRCRVFVPEKKSHNGKCDKLGGCTPEKNGAPSDIRLKTNIHRVGTTVMNLPLYSFEYRGKQGTYIGVMAQDVLKVEPAAVTTGSDGFYRVDYSKLGIEMLQVQ